MTVCHRGGLFSVMPVHGAVARRERVGGWLGPQSGTGGYGDAERCGEAEQEDDDAHWKPPFEYGPGVSTTVADTLWGYANVCRSDDHRGGRDGCDHARDDTDARLHRHQGSTPEAPAPHRGTGSRRAGHGRGGPLVHRRHHADLGDPGRARQGRTGAARRARAALRDGCAGRPESRPQRRADGGRRPADAAWVTAMAAPHSARSLNAVAFSATVHCLTGCAIGEVLGMVVGTALGFGDAATIALSIVLAFLFGYGLTSMPLLRSGMALAAVVPIALASDTVSIAIMEVVDNALMLAVPGAMDAGLDDVRFWGSLALALLVAGAAAFPVNRWLIARGRGHAVVHAHHGAGPAIGPQQ